MAIYPLPNPAGAAPVDNNAHVHSYLAEQLANLALNASPSNGFHGIPSTSAANPPGRSVSLAIELDEQEAVKSDQPRDPRATPKPRREPLRRDSLKRREALLKGKEGSRRRRQWENDRLLNNPWAQPPQPTDWEVQPTHRKQAVPYYLAPLWDQDAAGRKEAREKARAAAVKKSQACDEAQGAIPREIREKLKKARSTKGLLRDLEEQVREFVESWEAKSRQAAKMEVDSEDEEIVFVGRKGHMPDVPPSPRFRDSLDEDEDERQQLVFESLADDRGASFGRWLVHSIASYYGLRTWSVTVGDPARREAYVGIPHEQDQPQPVSLVVRRPLWGIV